jgi:membrane associated rhomboid family serine protease
MSIYERRKKIPFTTNLQDNNLMMLIIINLVVFVLFVFVEVFYSYIFTKEVALVRFNNDIYANLAIPGKIEEFIRKPWTLITHMFYHFKTLHLLGNMLWLWTFGYIFYDLAGNRKIIPLFIYGALGGAVAFLLAYSFVPVLAKGNANLIGASGGIMAIVVATTMLAPDFRIFPMIRGGIPLWVLTIIYLAIDLILLADNNTGGHIAHLAGGFTGFLFIWFLRRGTDWSDGMNNFFSWVSNLFNPNRPRKKIKEEQFYKQGRTPFSKTPHLNQQRIDAVLDKINQMGYHSLSAEEKDLLKRASKEDL